MIFCYNQNMNTELDRKRAILVNVSKEKDVDEIFHTLQNIMNEK